MTSTVTVRGQTAIPVCIRKRYNIKPQALLEWIDDGHSIAVVPIPLHPIKALKRRFLGAHLRNALLRSRLEEKRFG
jgi:bifunctional DNA-binding transcriptional regulator/antitoxin component of YhaV-PrlF toxin-antitoxin module